MIRFSHSSISGVPRNCPAGAAGDAQPCRRSPPMRNSLPGNQPPPRADRRFLVLDDLIETLRQRCIEKPGVTIRSDDRDVFGILEGYLDTFAKFYPEESPPVLMIRCGDVLRNQ